MTLVESLLLATYIVGGIVVFVTLVWFTLNSLDYGAWWYRFLMAFVWVLAIGLMFYIGSQPR